MDYESILFEVADGVATLTFNRPDKLNCLNRQRLAEIRHAVARAGGDATVRCLMLTGAGRAFSTGQDLGERRAAANGAAPDLGGSLDRNYNPLVRALVDLEIPVLAAVNGPAVGAGANIALVCDIVLAARSAYFLQAFSNIGLVPDCGGSFTLPRLVGRARALGLALLGERLEAPRAAEWGLIWACVEDQRLMPEASDLARRLAQRPTKALGLIKRAFRAGNGLDAQLDLERDLQRIAAGTDDFREGVDAFLEKRAPRFRGH